jgi:hypothetical protein
MKLILIIVTTVLLYLGSYCVLSANGTYQGLVSTSINLEQLWVPKYMVKEASFEAELNYLGYFYRPLVYIDRNYCHQNSQFVLRADFEVVGGGCYESIP